ncbi:aminoacyl-tRNA deacylase [Thermotalea metallivorans]|uniref:Cys-tRNA(Pro)/Cys-tRNA(Cys) deacylase YbaK n=1 Tax=Thermotalea metallivorans TaxID=520762 RepID=A0A140L971_9FIRM|nr:YbaK/EbsC family protein [Thermotalea metallivorans]KXG77096.1 Cys-tRNA(Pro)/Cys-tRNA(Cys) deacylase YbaK [Thermotalea metallivorans]
MGNFEEKLIQYMCHHHIAAKHLTFQESCHSVEEAARAANALPEDLVKNICLIDEHDNLIVAIVKGEDKVDPAKISKLLNIKKPRTAKPEEILEKTGYICGGVPSFGYAAVYLIDAMVMEKDIVYSGGGSQNSLVKISPQELLRANGGKVADIRK